MKSETLYQLSFYKLLNSFRFYYTYLDKIKKIHKDCILVLQSIVLTFQGREEEKNHTASFTRDIEPFCDSLSMS